MITEAMTDSRFLNLLDQNRDNTIVSDCLGRISQAGEVRYGASMVVHLKEIIDIYSVRAQINAELNDGVVEGFDELIPALQDAPGPSVKLQALEFVTHWFVVFSDESMSYLFGILKSPKKKSAWFDPLKGYGE
jgi:hypothetical protein